MNYEEIVAKVKDAAKNVDVSNVQEHAAYQFNITGEGEGAFYIEINDGKMDVQPYEYFDRDILVFTSASDLVDILEGKTDFVNAYLTGKISAEGDLRKADLLKGIGAVKKEAAKKAPAKKAPAKKEASSKTTAKKTTAKKAPAKKTVKK
ncbi:MAG: SCP2 sterol-binding domain-containing protein [Butyrivibrio sp.]|nr:SCP2 sterol-binding domain-containing protein [Butyrivibrio sp.]